MSEANDLFVLSGIRPQRLSCNNRYRIGTDALVFTVRRENAFQQWLRHQQALQLPLDVTRHEQRCIRYRHDSRQITFAIASVQNANRGGAFACPGGWRA